jgi:hypothetical protein
MLRPAILLTAVMTVGFAGTYDKQQLMTLFGMATDEVAPGSRTCRGPSPDLPPHMRGPQQVPDRGPSSWTWNDRGERQQKLPSSFTFTRGSERPATNNWRTR